MERLLGPATLRPERHRGACRRCSSNRRTEDGPSSVGPNCVFPFFFRFETLLAVLSRDLFPRICMALFRCGAAEIPLCANMSMVSWGGYLLCFSLFFFFAYLFPSTPPRPDFGSC